MCVCVCVVAAEDARDETGEGEGEGKWQLQRLVTVWRGAVQAGGAGQVEVEGDVRSFGSGKKVSMHH